MDDDDREFYRWYGPWEPLVPGGVADLLAGLDAPWWIVGGWAIDAFTGRAREHEDIDVAFRRADLPALLDHLLPTVCVWSNADGTLRPLKRPEDLLDGCRQLWVRRDGASPWVADLAMTAMDGETWVSPRDDRVRVPFDMATFVASDGIRYLRPEIVLSFKARVQRPKDEADFAAVLPLLDDAARDWLFGTVELLHPGHPWLRRIDP